MISPKVIDDFLPSEVFDYLKEFVVGNANFPWYHMPSVSGPESDDGTYFIHTIYAQNAPNSASFNNFIPLIEKIQPYAINRIKVNFYPTTNEIVEHNFHVDEEFTHHGAIFYLNTCNGKTIFESGEIIDSVENRLLLFDPSEPHKSTTCTDHEFGRYNINMNFFETPLLNT